MVATTPRIPTPQSAEQARAALRALQPVTTRTRARTVRLRAAATDKAPTVEVPKDAFNLFLEILGQMANGNAVTLVPIHAELTTQQAADLLNVSRPHLIQLLKDRKIPFHLVGSHRRLRAEDVFRFKARVDEERQQILDDLAAEAQKHGLGY